MTYLQMLTQWLSKKGMIINVPDHNISFSYIIRYSGNSNRTDSLPMLIALHGDFDTVENFYKTALDDIREPARIIVIKGPIPHSQNSVWPFLATQLEEYGSALSKAVNLLTTEYPTVNKPLLLGFSGGGVTAYYQAIKYGTSYSYIFPISALLSKEQLGKGDSNPHAKVYAYHGKSDTVVPFSEGKKAVKLLKKKKVTVSFTEFQEGHQGFYTNMKPEIIRTVEEKLNSLWKA